MRSFITYTLWQIQYNYNDEVKEDEMGRACCMHGVERNAYMTLLVEPEGKRPLRRPTYRWK
jgi:hypothetical protein